MHSTTYPFFSGLLCCLSSFLVLLLPETTGCALPETLEQAVSLGQTSSERKKERADGRRTLARAYQL